MHAALQHHFAAIGGYLNALRFNLGMTPERVLDLTLYIARLNASWLGTAEGKRTIGLDDSYTPTAPIIVGHPGSTAPAVQRNAP